MRPSLVVRAGVREDAEGIARVRMLSWQSAYKGIMPQGFLDAMDLSDQAERTRRLWPRGEDPAHLVATLESEVVGWTCIKLASEEPGGEAPEAEILACYTLPRCWGQGIGFRMIEAALAALGDRGTREVVLWVLESNQRARSFYQRQGFHPDGHLKQETFIPGVTLSSMRMRRAL